MALEDNIKNPDVLTLLKAWDKSGLSHDDVKAEEKRLSNLFEEAVKNGADPKTLANILDEWKGHHHQLNQMEKQLFDGRAAGEDPDVFQEYVQKAKGNLAKGMSLLSDKTKEFTEQVKDGSIKGGVFTDKIKNAHQSVMTIFHAKQAELSEKFGKFLSNLKENIRDKRDFGRVNRWVRATEKAEEAKLKSQEGYAERVAKLADKISGQTAENLKRNEEKFQKAVDNVENPSFISRLKAGAKTISDAIQGKEYKEYTADKNSEEAAKDLKTAKEKLEKADAKSIFIDNVKLGVVKAWTKLAVAFDQFKAQQYEKLADKSREELDKVQNPEAKGFAERMQEYQEQGMSMKDALDKATKETSKEANVHDLEVDSEDKVKNDLDLER